VAFAVVDAARARLSYCSAGHPPPIVVRPDGEPRFLEDGRSWPIGVANTARPRAAEAPFPAGSLLLLYTDGLVERRGERLDVGFERLAEVVARCWNLPLPKLKQQVFRELVDDRPPSDDVAIAAVRTVGATPHLFADVIAADPGHQAPFRVRLRRWLEERGLPVETREAFVLAVGEAMANAIDHGCRRDASQVVRVEIAARPGELVATVTDSGTWQTGVEGFFAGRGRGHTLMLALADDVEVQRDHQGTAVTLRLRHEVVCE
jgi:anti-sigma regulatory factor (Ser/Thr protein kinase)